MTDRKASAIVLAGGRSIRFGRDKLAEPVDGRPLLEYAIGAVAAYADEVLVVAAPAVDVALPGGAFLVHDSIAHEGPLVGLLAGLRAARGPLAIVVGGDMPTLVGPVLELLLAGLGDAQVDAVVLEHDGRPRPLPMAVRVAVALAAAARLTDTGERRLRALTIAMPTRVIPEAAWRAIDPDARTVRDVDVPDDLP
jgi:molybdopterin-guanine dinucleotide biosynthesis protein A